MKSDTPPTAEQLEAVIAEKGHPRLTAGKAAVVAARDGWEVTGFVLSCPRSGRRAIVERSAVRWLSAEEMWWIMHDSPSPLPGSTPEN